MIEKRPSQSTEGHPQWRSVSAMTAPTNLNTFWNLKYEASHRLVTQRQTLNFEKQNTHDFE
jgi:hypothetical protein